MGQLTHREESGLKRLRSVALLQRWSGLAIQDALTIERKSFAKMPNGWYRLFLRRAKTGVEVYVSLAPNVAADILSAEPMSDRYLFWDGKESRNAIVQRYVNA